VKLNSLPHDVLLKLVEWDERAARLAKAADDAERIRAEAWQRRNERLQNAWRAR
jgi:hypothetical protein